MINSYYSSDGDSGGDSLRGWGYRRAAVADVSVLSTWSQSLSDLYPPWLCWHFLGFSCEMWWSLCALISPVSPICSFCLCLFLSAERDLTQPLRHGVAFKTTHISWSGYMFPYSKHVILTALCVYITIILVEYLLFITSWWVKPDLINI